METLPGGAVRILLREPVSQGSLVVTELVVQPFRGKYMRGIPADPSLILMDHSLLVAARATGQPPTVIDELGAEDFGELMGVVGGFFARIQPTGGPA